MKASLCFKEEIRGIDVLNVDWLARLLKNDLFNDFTTNSEKSFDDGKVVVSICILGGRSEGALEGLIHFLILKQIQGGQTDRFCMFCSCISCKKHIVGRTRAFRQAVSGAR
jgi:hypothetical protein